MYRFSCYLTLWTIATAAGVLGRVIKHELTLTWEVGAPNGQARELIKMNGQFPGPAYVWDEDDDIEVRLIKIPTGNAPGSRRLIQGLPAQVTVHNRMPFNTSVHWHGLL